ncbi:hypothetical protein B0H11DRAFT_1707238 [Mycena galericulata]|nr:hypothetical protein B0H11DRAFT_1707238 [Mycena galericulata]
MTTGKDRGNDLIQVGESVATRHQALSGYGGSNIPSEFVDPTRPVRTVGTMAIASAAVARRNDPANPGLFVCGLCGRDFTAKHNYKNHLNSHYSVRPFHCEKCGEDFGTLHVMRRHQGKCNASI